QPSAILLDISLPDIEGWRVLERLKNDPALRHIPVHIVSTVDQPERGLKLGAQGVLPKPIQTGDVLEEFLENVKRQVERMERRVLLVEPDSQRAQQIADSLSCAELELVIASAGAEALEKLQQQAIDAAILTPEPSDMSLASLAEQMTAGTSLERGAL